MTKAIKQFLEADALRTQGEWAVTEAEYEEYWCAFRHYNVGQACGIESQYDATFIAAASLIPQEIRAMQDAFEQVCEALAIYRRREIADWREKTATLYANHDVPSSVADAALEAAAPYHKMKGV